MQKPRSPDLFRALYAALAIGGGTFAGLAAAEGPQPAPARQGTLATGSSAERDIGAWLRRMHEASRLRSYIGTFVVSSTSGGMSSARIWHACEGEQQIERVESLSGPPRSTFRRNDEIVTFLPESRLVRAERRESLGLFPNLIQSAGSSIPVFYSARSLGADRVAGFEADVVQLVPRDGLRFGYRIWSERKTGLVVKFQTVAPDGTVLEQAAFSELALDAPVSLDKLSQMMGATEGWRVERSAAQKTTAAAEGWQLKTEVPGFQAVSCYRRQVLPLPDGTLQWVFSDGLAAVSLFIEAYDRQRHVHEGQWSAGATQTLTRRVQDWWVTAVGEVPPQTLRAFAMSLEHRK